MKTTFTTDWGNYAYTVMPFGLCNASKMFQRVMTQAFQKYLRISMEIFLDDFCTFNNRKDHLDWLGKCLDQCDQFGISLNLEKCIFGVPSEKLLDHIVSQAGIETDPDKVNRIANFSRPDTVSGVRGFVGHVSYYRRFIKSFAILCQPLTNLLKKLMSDGTSPVWTHDCTLAFEELKQKLVMAPIFIFPCWTKQFHIYVDASNVAIGAILSQKDDKNCDHPIYYASRQLVAAKRNYTTTERKDLGMIYSIQKF
ncbi:MAG: reverse transcriptase family protein [Nitrosotalea sp.]